MISCKSAINGCLSYALSIAAYRGMLTAYFIPFSISYRHAIFKAQQCLGVRVTFAPLPLSPAASAPAALRPGGKELRRLPQHAACPPSLLEATAGGDE